MSGWAATVVVLHEEAERSLLTLPGLMPSVTLKESALPARKSLRLGVERLVPTGCFGEELPEVGAELERVLPSGS